MTEENLNIMQIFLLVEIQTAIKKDAKLTNPFQCIRIKLLISNFTFQDIYDVAKKVNCLIMINSHNELLIFPNIGFNNWFVGNIMFHNSFVFGFKLFLIKLIQMIFNGIMKLDLSELKKANQQAYNNIVRNLTTLCLGVGSFSLVIHTVVPVVIMVGTLAIQFFVKFNHKWLTNIVNYWQNKKDELLKQKFNFR